MKSFFIALMILCIPVSVCASDLRIGLNYGSKAVESAVFAGSSKLYMSHTEDAEMQLCEAPLTISAADGMLMLNDSPIGQPKCVIYPADNRDTLTYNGAEYRGYFEVNASENGLVTVINIVDCERYLYSVLGKEMSPSWPIEALKAQAIAARTFARSHLNKHTSHGFDLCAETDCQVYSGVGAEAKSTVQAVDETAEKVLTYDGKLIQAVYFATSGGHTEDVENVWGNPFPYLMGVEDPYENPQEASYSTWTTQILKTDIEARLDIGKIIDMQITERTPSGRVLKLVIKGSAGEKTLEREQARTFFATPNVRSTFYDIVSAANNEQVWILGGNLLNSSCSVLSGSNVGVLGGSVIALGVSGTKEYDLGGGSTGDSFQLSGKGWGHGVGMSQWGAKGMADNGFSAEEILKHYYTGVEIE